MPAGSPFYDRWHRFLETGLSDITPGSGGGGFYDASQTDVNVLGERYLTWMAFPRRVMLPTRRDDRMGAFAFRDLATDLGKPADTLLRMVLRRGIPFGPPIAGVKRPPRALVRKERGLMFVCYGATIEDQFEFLTRRWVNSAIHPTFGAPPIDAIAGVLGA